MAVSYNLTVIFSITTLHPAHSSSSRNSLIFGITNSITLGCGVDGVLLGVVYVPVALQEKLEPIYGPDSGRFTTILLLVSP